ncbi:MAG: hypothetical protein SPJ34_02205 [Candidatus Ornithospirochaeta sp.]|nr:hypothetical protein [Candidatus Ornithospirochaeta sp.]
MAKESAKLTEDEIKRLVLASLLSIVLVSAIAAFFIFQAGSASFSPIEDDQASDAIALMASREWRTDRKGVQYLEAVTGSDLTGRLEIARTGLLSFSIYLPSSTGEDVATQAFYDSGIKAFYAVIKGHRMLIYASRSPSGEGASVAFTDDEETVVFS